MSIYLLKTIDIMAGSVYHKYVSNAYPICTVRNQTKIKINLKQNVSNKVSNNT